MIISLLLLTIALLGAALPSAAQISLDQPYEFVGRNLELNLYATTGWNRFNIGDLNTRLRNAGYQTFPRNFLSLGGGGNAHIRRIVLAVDGSLYLTSEKSSLDGTAATRLRGGAGLVQAGYDILPPGSLSLYPLLGVGFGIMELALQPASSANFNDVLTDPRRMSRLDAFTALINIGLGGEYRIPLIRREASDGGLLIGFRTGYMFSPTNGNWKLNGASLAGGPALDMSGPYFKMFLGAGLRYMSGILEYE